MAMEVVDGGEVEGSPEDPQELEAALRRIAARLSQLERHIGAS